VPQAISRLGADLYHSPYYLMPYRPRAATVLTVYDVIPLRHPEHSTQRARLLFRLSTRLALRAARRVIAITENARQDFVGEFAVPPDKITAIPLGVDPSFRPAGAVAVREVRAKYQLPERFALYLGSNKPHKNLVGLVRAWTTLPDPPAALVVAGAWDDRYPDARQIAASCGDKTISWIGRIAEVDLPALYSAARVFIFPSLFEGFGLPVVEAMACGAPVICSNVTALPEVAGDAAQLFDPTDQSALARVIQQTLDDETLLAQLRGKGLARAARFSWERTAAQTLEIYRQVIA
jgi:alpha-1,3-rhamnosyl/mannosyltransferase